MNKKIYVGMMAFGVAATFWACGSGDIIKADKDDETMSIIVEDNPSLGVSKDVMTRETCPQCFEGSVLSSSSSKKQTPVSSATVSSSSSPFGPSTQSSSSSELIINMSSSSSRAPYVPRSSFDIGPIIQSSSSAADIVIPGNEVGSCEPTPATISAGGKTTWKYTRGSAVQAAQLLNAAFAWEFEDGTPATANVTGAGGMSQSVTYTTSGKHGAKVTLTIGASHYPVTCSPVQVNGAAITGCKCTASNKAPDIAAGEVGTWTVTGCVSAGANIVGYEWDGATPVDGNPSLAMLPFTKKKQGAAPTVKVSNDDNTVQAFKCDSVVAVDANDPDYVITGGTTGTFTVGPGTYKMVYGCKADQYDQRPIVVEAPSGAVSGTVGGVKFSVSPNGRAETYKSTTSNVPIDVEITSGTAKITCG